MTDAVTAQDKKEKQLTPTQVASLSTRSLSKSAIDSSNLIKDVTFLIKQTANKLSFDPEHLREIIAFETANAFDPTIRNPRSGAIGLIQFTEIAAADIGTSLNALEKMNVWEQWIYVEKYLTKHLKDVKRPINKTDLYLAIFAPAYIGSSASTAIYTSQSNKTAYFQNVEFDLDLDGSIQKFEIAEVLESRNNGTSAAFKGEGFFDVQINGRKTGLNIPIKSLSEKQILILKSDFEKFGFSVTSLEIQMDNLVYINLNQIDGGRYAFDLSTYQFNIFAPIEWFKPETRDYLYEGSGEISKTIPAFVSNYRADLKLSNLGDHFFNLAQQNTYFHPWANLDFDQSITAKKDSLNFNRLYTRLSKDLPEYESTLTAGDSFTGPLSNQLYGFGFLGLRLSSDRYLRPSYNPYRSYSLDETLNEQSDVSVLVNGRAIDSFKAGPGKLNLSNFPVANGDGSITVAITGKDGQYYERIIPFTKFKQFYKRGTYNFDYNFGLARQDINEYRNPFLSSTQSYALNDEWDISSTILASNKEHFIALSSAFAIQKLMYFEPSTSFGVRSDDFIYSIGASTGLLETIKNWNFTADINYASGGGRLSLVEDEWLGGNDTISASASLSKSLAGFGMISAYGRIFQEDAKPKWLAGAAWRGSIAKDLFANLQVFSNNENLAITAGVTMDMGQQRGRISNRTSMSENATKTSLRYTNNFKQDKSILAGSHVLFQADKTLGINKTDKIFGYDRIGGQIGTQSLHGNHYLSLFQDDRETYARISTSGAVGFVDGSVFTSQSINGPAAIVTANEDVQAEIKKSNMTIGTVSKKKPLIVTKLTPLRVNKISLNTEDLDKNFSIDESTVKVTPPKRGFVPINFNIMRKNPKTIILTFPDGSVPSAGSIVNIEGVNEKPVVSLDGEVYVEDMPVVASISIRYKNKLCKKMVSSNINDQEDGEPMKILLECQ